MYHVLSVLQTYLEPIALNHTSMLLPRMPCCVRSVRAQTECLWKLLPWYVHIMVSTASWRYITMGMQVQSRPLKQPILTKSASRSSSDK